MSCGADYSAGCGMFFGSRCGMFSSDRGTLRMPSGRLHAGSCGVSVPCGGVPCGTVVEPKRECVNISRKTYIVFDISDDRKTASCFIEKQKNGGARHLTKDVDINELRNYLRKGEYEARELIGISVKKDGSFKLKPKELKPYKEVLKKSVPNFKEHYAHMKEVKKEMKEERDNEFEIDER